MANARKIASQVLLEVEEKAAYSNITLNRAFVGQEISPQDKALATAIIYGVLDRQITLDFVISQFVKTPLKKIRPKTLSAIKIALYQIMFMDKIPQSAAVNESVNLIKNSNEKHNAAFVNAVLRNILRQGIKLPTGNTAADLSVRYSCPEWIVESFIDDYGLDNAVALLESSLEAPDVNIRVNTLKTDRDKLIGKLAKEGITAKPCQLSEALVIDGNIDVNNSVCFSEGLFHVQDTASQTVASLLSAQSGERILDMCSAPGGKAFTTAQYMQNKGEIVACDIHEKRVELIKKGARRLGVDIIKTSVWDATVYDDKKGSFDAVLCDVLCSGLGVIRRKPEIKYKNLDEFSDITRTQQEILENAALYLKPQGRILYSTCTLRTAENEAVINAFLDKHSGYELKYEHTFMPHIDGTDGFYCALIQKSR